MSFENERTPEENYHDDEFASLDYLFDDLQDIAIEDEYLKQSSSAMAESNAMATGKDIGKEAEENQHGRREKIRDVISGLTCWWVKIAAILLIITTVIWFYHLLTPDHLKWLKQEQIINIKETLSNILVGAVFGYLVKERFM